jgi:hypothetical protein
VCAATDGARVVAGGVELTSTDGALRAAAVRTAAGHMQMIADPLAETIVKQFPDRYIATAK